MTFLVGDNEAYPHIQWDTPLNKLIPSDFALSNEYATTHTSIEDALSHRSGLPGHDCCLPERATVQSIVRVLSHLPLTAEPRTKYQYCNAMYIVASHVIETVTKRKLGDLISEWIWKPLGMDSSYFDIDSAKSAKEDLAHAYRYLYDKDEGGFEDLGWMELDGVAGAGSVISNVLDYAKWARAIMSKSTPLSSKGFEAWFTPRTLMPFDPPFTGPRLYTLGWRTGVYQGKQFYAHSGGMKGFGVELLIFPEMDFAVVVMANTSGTSNFLGQKLSFHLVDQKMNIPLEARFDWNKRNQHLISKGQLKSYNAAKFLYPLAPSPAISLSLPIPSYTGTYHHSAYGDLTISLDHSRSSSCNPSTLSLRADRTYMMWAQILLFEHVSGEFFVGRSKTVYDFGALYDDVYPVEFRVGSDGMVKEVGVGWEEAMKEEKIWLRRVEGSKSNER